MSLTIVLSSAPVAESDEDKSGVILDYEGSGNIVTMEILEASRRDAAPDRMDYRINTAA
jgi:uncharacterized protein YuzE